MATSDSLKRLGGGRWETRDGRFAIEPQSGTWAVVDNTQTDELGLPLVRGPYKSLTAAKQAIEEARSAAAPASPLADRLSKAKATAAKSPRAAGRGSRGADTEPAKEPEPPTEPKWLRDLEPAERRQARQLIERLKGLDVGDDEAEGIARSEVVRDQPALARLALERRLAKVSASADDAADAVRRVVDLILGGKDAELGVRWRLVDDDGRRIEDLDLSG